MISKKECKQVANIKVQNSFLDHRSVNTFFTCPFFPVAYLMGGENINDLQIIYSDNFRNQNSVEATVKGYWRSSFGRLQNAEKVQD